jgi:uncharacterized low-complexity protein
MRFVIAAAALVAVLMGAASAQAEKRVFIIANNADGYGVTGAIPASGPGSCGGATCDNFVAIVCSR